jgi:hypothetical protein
MVAYAISKPENNNIIMDILLHVGQHLFGFL